MEQRKEFYLDNNPEFPIRAGGVLIYKFDKNNNMYLLMIKSRGQYEDIGGRVDNKDNDIIDTVVREVYEESNKLIKRKNTREKLKNAKFVYNKKSKYVIYFIEATKKQSNFTEKNFDTYEYHDNIKRTIKWMPLKTVLSKNFINYSLAFRLKHKYVFDMLNSIEQKHIISKIKL